MAFTGVEKPGTVSPLRFCLNIQSSLEIWRWLPWNPSYPAHRKQQGLLVVARFGNPRHSNRDAFSKPLVLFRRTYGRYCAASMWSTVLRKSPLKAKPVPVPVSVGQDQLIQMGMGCGRDLQNKGQGRVKLLKRKIDADNLQEETRERVVAKNAPARLSKGKLDDVYWIIGYRHVEMTLYPARQNLCTKYT